jgi:hypothetical protein
MGAIHSLTAEKMYERILNLKAQIGEITSIEELSHDTLIVNGNMLVVFNDNQEPSIRQIEVDILADAEEKALRITDGED